MTIDDFLSRLQQVKPTGRDQWSANCPAHEDRNPSLSVRQSGGKILAHCFRGCSVNAVVEAMGLKLGDLFPDEAAGKTAGREIVATYDYVDAKGRLVYQVVRFEPKKFAQRRPDGLGGWEWKLRNVKRVLYRLPQVMEAVARGERIWLLEGEKDVAAAEALGLVATTNAGGAGKWKAAYTEALTGARVVMVPDNDEAGRGHAELIARECREAAVSIKIVHLPGLPEKADLSDWLAGGHVRDELDALVEQAEEWAPAPIAGGLFALSDLGNAERLIARHGEELHYVPAFGLWHWWTGQMWAGDTQGEVQRRASETVRSIRQEAELIADGDQQSEYLKHAKRSESARALAGMVDLARWREGIPLPQSALDANPWALNVLNGTIDLRTGVLREHDPGALCTKLAPVAYDAGEGCPRWLQFLGEIFEGYEEVVGYLQVLCGYLLTGVTSEQEVYFFTGKGANGKGVLIDTIGDMMGDYAAVTPFDTFLEHRSSPTNDLAALVGARVVTASEGSAAQSFHEGLLKRLSGGDRISCRFLWHEFFDYTPAFKVIFATNEIPRLRGQSYAIRRRVRVIPFRRTYYLPWEGREPVRDAGLRVALKEELAGILAWAVRGSIEWREKGLTPPAVVIEESAGVMEQMDALADFLEEECVVQGGCEAATDGMWRAYWDWCDERKIRPVFRSQQALTRNLAARSGISVLRRHGGRYLRGVALRSEFQGQLPDVGTAEKPEAAGGVASSDEGAGAEDEGPWV